MAITRKEVLHVARLARLAMSDDEADRLGGQLSAILDYVKQLDRLDTGTSSPRPRDRDGHPFRDDVVEPFGDREALLANAPDRQNDCFRVPRSSKIKGTVRAPWRTFRHEWTSSKRRARCGRRRSPPAS